MPRIVEKCEGTGARSVGLERGCQIARHETRGRRMSNTGPELNEGQTAAWEADGDYSPVVGAGFSETKPRQRTLT